MPPLTDLVTRFGFEVDKRGVSAFDTTIGGIKRSLVGLGGLLGVGFGVKQMIAFGKEASQAKVQFDLATMSMGDGANDVKDAIGEVGDNLGELKSLFKELGAGERLSATFFADFENASQDSLEQFKSFARAATVVAFQMGTDVEQEFAKMVEAARSGNVDALKGLPGITEKEVDLFKLRAQIVGEAAGPAQSLAIQSNMKVVGDIVDSIIPDMLNRINERVAAGRAKDASPTDAAFANLAAGRGAASDFQQSLQKLSEIIGDKLTPVLTLVADGMEKLNNAISKSKDLTDVAVNLTDSETLLGTAARFWDKFFEEGERRTELMSSRNSANDLLADVAKSASSAFIEPPNKTFGAHGAGDPIEVHFKVDAETIKTFQFTTEDELRRVLDSALRGAAPDIEAQIRNAIRANQPIEIPRPR